MDYEKRGQSVLVYLASESVSTGHIAGAKTTQNRTSPMTSRAGKSTKAIHAGAFDPRIEGAITTPIFQSSTYEYHGEDVPQRGLPPAEQQPQPYGSG